jgi:hypothetical protein
VRNDESSGTSNQGRVSFDKALSDKWDAGWFSSP